MALKKSTLVFGAVVFALLVVCVGLLVALLRSQNELASQKDRPKATTTTDHQLEPLTSSTAIPPDDPSNNPRLSGDVIPLTYDLTLTPDLDANQYTGELGISVTVTSPTRHIILYYSTKKYEIHKSSVAKDNDIAPIEMEKTYDNPKTEYYVFVMKNPLDPGNYTLRFTFSGLLSGSIVGFYRSTYTIKETGETRYLATSKFQPTFARRAFPCFDEPRFKSVFKVTLIHKPKYIALSNMPVKKDIIKDRPDGLYETKFEPSFPMVTYLACFIVCDFEGVTENFGPDPDNKFTVYATPEQKSKTAKALDYGVRILKFYEDYFGIKYPLPKLDMIAIPDFPSGAMEHWGLITYRETNLLYDEKESSPQNLQRVASVISHELAHMWFGNLVTMDWWKDLWLNEGFASYIEYRGVESVEKDWMMMDQLLTEDIQPVMRIDSTTKSHPIIQEVETPEQITEIFDAISYNKGAAILRMLENLVTSEKFKKGISNFLKNNIYGNANTTDLWRELSAVSEGMDIAKIMDTWTIQMGLPVVKVERVQGSPGKFRLSQKRFLLNPSMEDEKEKSPYKYLWEIPLTYVTPSSDVAVLKMFSKSDGEIQIDGVNDDDWVKFNKDQMGYYLVNYEEKEWTKFEKLLQAKHEALSPSDRSNLLFDAFQLAQSGELTYDVPLRLTTYLMNEQHLTPWETAYGSLVQLGHLLQDAEGHKEYRTFLQHITLPLYRKFGWKVQPKHTDSLLQTTIIGLACYSGNKDCRQQALQKLKDLKSNEQTEIPLALRNIVFKYAMEESKSEELWNFLWDRYVKETSAQEKLKLLYGMAHVQNPVLIQRLLDEAMEIGNSSLIRDQDVFTVLTYVAGNNIGRPLVWDLVTTNWNNLTTRFGLDDRNLGRAVKSICDYFNQEEQLKAMEKFFASTPDAGAGARAREQAIENVKTNIKWLVDNKQNVSQWLSKDSWVNYRLTDDVVPEKYELTLQPNMKENTFTGEVEILVSVKKKTNLFIVHIYNLEVTETTVLTSDKSTQLEISSTFEHKPNEFWVTELKEPVEAGSSVILKYKFNGFLNNSLVGMYRSSYKDATNVDRYLVTSQFQSTYARRAFPCFDEPKFKSVFKISLIHGKEFTALSNMQVEGDPVPSGELLKTNFKESVKMVTYLVCVIISDFKNTTASTKDNKVQVSVFARPEEVQKTKYALDVAVKTLDYFSDYFGIKYPLDKLDMIAIPDFQAGAMENWGLVTYREALLLYDANETPNSIKYRIAAVIGHELAHMWFGNLVTMKWWNDLWLNEGFASYMEYKSMTKVEPDWNVESQFYLEDVQRVLQPDALITSHPIVQEVNHPDEISASFDAISYSKGASVLRMLQYFLGNEVFQKGVSNYLKKFEYSNAVTSDLWHHLQEAFNVESQVAKTKDILNVSSIMDTWTRQMGFPCVNVEKKSSKDGIVTYQLKQERFLLDPNAKGDENSPYGYKWDIPISYVSSKTLTESVITWLKKDTVDISVDIGSPPWIKFNSGGIGYYVVNYQEEDWKLITQQLMDVGPALLAVQDRSNLIGDAFLLARSGRLSYDIALDLTKYLKKESDYVPWEAAKRSIAYVKQVLQHEKSTDGQLKNYLETLSREAFDHIDWTNAGNHLKRRLRETLVGIACSSENPKCLKKMASYLTEWKEKKTPINPDLRMLVYHYGMVEVDDASVWDYTWEAYEKEKSSQEQKNLLYGLAATRNVTLLNQLLGYAEDETKIRKQDYFTVIDYIAGNPVGLPLVWQYFRDNWDKLVARFTIHDRYLGGAVKSICNHFTTEARLEEMKDFFLKHPEAGSGERSRQEALDNVHSNIGWLKRFKPIVHDWLQKQKKMPWHDPRLNKNVSPKHYELKLHPNLDQGDFSGSVEIQVSVTAPETEISYFVVHSNMLVINKCQVLVSTGADLPVKENFLYKRNEFLVVELTNPVPPGDYRLKFEFTGSLLAGLVGFYRSSYKDSNTQEIRYLATSQFQSTYARRAFPCFDEPSFRSEFTVTLVHDPKMIALSNMPAETTLPNLKDPSLVETKFERSKSMVTYLVCVVVCDFESKEVASDKEVKIRAFAPSDRVNQTEFALSTAKNVLEYFEKYFDVPFPLPKLDMIALPDFRAGAMENWGLITYREIYLLFDVNETPPSAQYNIVMIIAHEIAHMWFGNLVTMKWWDDLWLNEGFATYMAHKCMEKVAPQMNPIGLFLLGETANVLETDATYSSHPIVQPVNDADEISSIFDSISYSKGASVLRMLESFLQEEVFKKGLKNYLTKYQYGNAVTKDLWTKLSEEYKISDVATIMNTWTEQMGYPVVEVTIQGQKAELSQKRFLINSKVKPPEEDSSPHNYTWSIPIHVHTDKEADLVWLKEKTATVDLSTLPREGIPYKLNYQQSGYYLVNYESGVWSDFASVLQNNVSAFDSLDRSNLLSDAFLLAKAGELNYTMFLNLTKYLSEEDNFIPWTTAKSGLIEITDHLKESKNIADMMIYLRDLSKKKFDELLWNDDPAQDYNNRRLRTAILDLACRAMNPKCLTEAKALLQSFLKENEVIPSALRTLVYRYGLWEDSATSGLWTALWDKFKSEPSAQAQRDFLYGLAFTKDKKQIENFLELAKNESNVRSQDFLTVLTNIANNPEGLDIAWDFIRKEWQFLVKRYSINDRGLGKLILSMSSHFSTKERLQQVKEFFANNPEAGAGKSAREESLEVIQSNIQWGEDHLGEIEFWLQTYVGTNGSS